VFAGVLKPFNMRLKSDSNPCRKRTFRAARPSYSLYVNVASVGLGLVAELVGFGFELCFYRVDVATLLREL
jgi:hypothetical protein